MVICLERCADCLHIVPAFSCCPGKTIKSVFLLCFIIAELSLHRGCHGPLQMEKDDKGSTMIRMGVSG